MRHGEYEGFVREHAVENDRLREASAEWLRTRGGDAATAELRLAQVRQKESLSRLDRAFWAHVDTYPKCVLCREKLSIIEAESELAPL